MKGKLPNNDVQKTTMKETTIDNERYGNMNAQERTQGAYKSTEYEAKMTQKQFTSDNEYMGIAERKQDDGYLVANYTTPLTQKQFLSDNDHFGVAGTTDAKGAMSMEEYLNAEINTSKEPTLIGREPTQESVKVAIGKEEVNQTSRKLEVDEYIERETNNIERIYGNPVNKDNDGTNTRVKLELDNDDRMDINVLSSLKTNPYAMKPFSESLA